MSTTRLTELLQPEQEFSDLPKLIDAETIEQEYSDLPPLVDAETIEQERKQERRKIEDELRQYMITHKKQGDTFLSKGQYHEAIASYSIALHIEGAVPADAYAGIIHQKIAKCYLAHSKQKQAIESLEQALQRFQINPTTDREYDFKQKIIGSMDTYLELAVIHKESAPNKALACASTVATFISQFPDKNNALRQSQINAIKKACTPIHDKELKMSSPILAGRSTSDKENGTHSKKPPKLAMLTPLAAPRSPLLANTAFNSSSSTTELNSFDLNGSKAEPQKQNGPN